VSDPGTRSIYEANAGIWATRRTPGDGAAAERLAARSEGPSIDLGCGPGWYTAMLAPPAVAFDFTRSMLELVPDYAPAAWRVQGDLTQLPFRRAAFASAGARNSYVHVAREAMPLALADLHRVLCVGARVRLALFGGDREGHDLFPDDDFPGRFFSLWRTEHVLDVVRGAGFDVDEVNELGSKHGERRIVLDLIRARTLPDVVGPGMRLLVCGLNPSLYAADAGIGFARPGNRFWPAALAAGLATVDRDTWHALQHHGIGFTDLVKRATVAAAELDRDEYVAGLGRLERLASWLAPDVIAFVGLAGWRAAVDRKAVAGPQDRTVGGRPVYLMPSSSGLNAHSTVDTLADHLRAALTVA
jgi:TDG/mug DNA glycosylase family protein